LRPSAAEGERGSGPLGAWERVRAEAEEGGVCGVAEDT
jgi:hypothetical protein